MHTGSVEEVTPTMIKLLRGLILTILLIWVLLAILQIDSHVGIGDLIIVLCLGGVYHYLGEVFLKEISDDDSG